MRKSRLYRSRNRGFGGWLAKALVAIVIGAAAIVWVSSVPGILGDAEPAELDVQLGDHESISGPTEITVRVVDENDEPVDGAEVDLESGSAVLQSDIQTQETNENGFATFETVDPGPYGDIDWKSNQNKGTLRVTISPPDSGEYKDAAKRSEIVVRKEY